MFIADNFVFVHFPRTGGTTLKSAFACHGIVGSYLSNHVAYRGIPSKYLLNREVFGFIRNPWDWYRSWAIKSYPTLPLNESLPKVLGDYGSFYQTIFPKEMKIALYEDREELLRDLLPSFGISQKVVSNIICHPRLEATKDAGVDYRQHYSEDMQVSVWEAERNIIEQYGYQY